MFVASQGDVRCVRVLLDGGVKVNIRAEGRLTVLHMLIRVKPANYHDIAYLIARHGVDIFAEAGVRGITPLQMTIEQRDSELVWALLMSSEYRSQEHLQRRTYVDMAQRMSFQMAVELLHAAAGNHDQYVFPSWENGQVRWRSQGLGRMRA